MIAEEKARCFANKWINSWNSHDIDSIMDHYDEKG